MLVLSIISLEMLVKIGASDFLSTSKVKVFNNAEFASMNRINSLHAQI
jgi:hypothetical protein